MYLPISIIAFILNGIAVTVDKFLLNKVIPDPLLYIFYFSLISFLAVFALPFTSIPEPTTLVLASISTILWTIGAYFMFKALKIGQIQRVIPVIGTLNPLILFVIGFQSFQNNEIWALLLLVFGLIFITANDWKGKIIKSEIIYEFLAALLFALSYLLLKEAYLHADTLSVLVYSRFVLIPLCLAFFIIPTLRTKVLPKPKKGVEMIKKGGFLFIVGQICAGISQILIFYAISLGSPALVNSIQGVQYVFLFILALLLSKKYPQIFSATRGFTDFTLKFLGIILICIGLYLLF